MLNRITDFLTAPKTSLFFIGLMFFIPFCVAYHHPPVATFYGEWTSAVLGVLAMLALFNKSFWQEVKIPQISLVFLGLAAIVVMQAMLGMMHSARFVLLILSYITWALLLVILGAHLRAQMGWEKLVKVLAITIVLGGIFNVIFVAFQIAMKLGFSVPLMPSLNSYGTLSQQNNFADYMGLAIASLLYLYSKRHLKATVFWLGLTLFIAMLAFSGSRSSWIYLIALTVLAIALQIKSIKLQTGTTQIRSLLRVSLLLLPMFALMQLFLNAILPDALINLPNERISAALSGGNSLRLQFWQTSWHLFTQHPWLGIGVGQLRWQSFLLMDSHLNASKIAIEHAHNLFLHLLAEMGIAACLIALVGLVSWLRAFKWRELNLETWWVIALLAIIGVHSQLEYPLWYAFFLGIAAFLLGAGDEKVTKIQMNNIGKTFASTGLLVVILLGSVNLVTMNIAYEKLERWMVKAIKKETAETKIDSEAFYNDFVWARQYSVLAPYAELMFLNSITPRENQVKDLIVLSESVMRFMPTQNMTYQHALLLKLNGEEAEAVKQMNRALIAYPKGLNASIERQPMKYWQAYLDILSIARPIPIKKSQKIPQKQ